MGKISRRLRSSMFIEKSLPTMAASCSEPRCISKLLPSAYPSFKQPASTFYRRSRFTLGQMTVTFGQQTTGKTTCLQNVLPLFFKIVLNLYSYYGLILFCLFLLLLLLLLGLVVVVVVVVVAVVVFIFVCFSVHLMFGF